MAKRGEIWMVDYGRSAYGSEQGGQRPVLVVQNDIGNRFGSTTIVVPITTNWRRAVKQPTHVLVEEGACEGLRHRSVLMTEQVRCIDLGRLFRKMGHLDDALMEKVNLALLVSLSIVDPRQVHVVVQEESQQEG